jgi:hypothetical protein
MGAVSSHGMLALEAKVCHGLVSPMFPV